MNIKPYTPHGVIVRFIGRRIVRLSQVLPDTNFSYAMYKYGLELSF